MSPSLPPVVGSGPLVNCGDARCLTGHRQPGCAMLCGTGVAWCWGPGWSLGARWMPPPLQLLTAWSHSPKSQGRPGSFLMTFTAFRSPRHKIERDGVLRKVYLEPAEILWTNVCFCFLHRFLGEAGEFLPWILTGIAANPKGPSSLECHPFLLGSGQGFWLVSSWNQWRWSQLPDPWLWKLTCLGWCEEDSWN